MIAENKPAGNEIALLLREVKEEDLFIFFEQHLDPEAVYMAAFTARDPADKAALAAHWWRILIDDEIYIRTLIWDGLVVGHVSSFEQFGLREVSYWLGWEYWGKRPCHPSFDHVLRSN